MCPYRPCAQAAHALCLSADCNCCMCACACADVAGSGHQPSQALDLHKPRQVAQACADKPIAAPGSVRWLRSQHGSARLPFFSAIIVSALLKGKAGLTNVSAAAAAGSMELKPVLLLSIPSAVAAVLAIAVAVHSQKRDEVYWHSSIPLIIAGTLLMVFPPLGQVSVGAGFFAVIVFA